MARETRSGGVKLEAVMAPSLKQKFKKLCVKEQTSMGQRVRDLIQADLKDPSACNRSRKNAEPKSRGK